MSETQNVDTVVIGAGVVGLAVARALACAGQSVMVLEQHAIIGSETSARNSEVIHAGMYYPTGSLKAKLCVQGNAMLYDYLADKGVAHQRLGKLIVATDTSQLAALNNLFDNAQRNHVPAMQYLTAQQAQALEPSLNCVAALYSGSTGIVDSHGLMLALQGDIEAADGMVVCHAQLTHAHVMQINGKHQGIELHVSTPDGPVQLLAKQVVNSAGLYATQIARTLHGAHAAFIPAPYYAKGSYYSLAQASPFKHLIYPLPFNGGLGVHITLDLGGQARFGPDAQWLDITHPNQIDYTVDPSGADSFYEHVRRYWPDLPDGALQPAYSGVRPKISGPNAPAADFMICTSQQHGVEGVVHLFGIESPGLTACMAIANEVERILKVITN